MAAVDNNHPDLPDSDIPVSHKRGLANYQEVKKNTNPPPKYTYFDAFKDYVRQFTLDDNGVETKLLSTLPFFPESDGKRKAQIINTPISNNNYIHEFYVENTQPSDTVKDVVLIHGYAASLGLFFMNFDAISSIPGVRLHAIDLLGFGFSSRPRFPNFKHDTVEDVQKIEDWFTDSIEEWRKKRNINNFILMGHSFGGYLSSCYAMKYNKKISDGQNLIDKLVLISPVGVERNRYSLLKNIPNPFFSDEVIESQNKNDNEVPIEAEFLQSQPTKNTSSSTASGATKDSTKDSTPSASLNPRYKHIDFSDDDIELTRSRKIIKHLWAKDFSFISIFRALGPLKPKVINLWTSRRFAGLHDSDPELYNSIKDYFYRHLSLRGSGENAITRVLDFGALPRVPLTDRLPQSISKMKTPFLLLYGDVDWMNVEAGKEMSDEINQLTSSKLSTFKVIRNAGHHVYLDNPDEFHEHVLKFIEH